MRTLNEIIMHCSATPEGRHHTVADIRHWHKKGNGWSDIGYHYVVYLDGTVHRGRPISKAGAHVRGHNKDTIGICYVGGVDKNGKAKDTRTDAQKAALRELILELIGRYGIGRVTGHNQYANKACPSFNAEKEYAKLLAFDGGKPVKDPSSLAKSRTLKGTGTAGVGAAGTALAEAASTIEPLAEMSVYLKWLFLLLIIGGVALATYARLDDAGVFNENVDA